MQLEIIETLDEIAELKADWNELFAKAKGGLFTHHSWVYQNYKHFPPESCKLIAVFGDRKKLIGVFPFAVKKLNIKFLSVRALVHGGSAVTDYSQFLIDPAANGRLMIKRVIQKLIEIQPSQWEFFKIDNLSDGDNTAKLFRNLLLKALYSGDTRTEVTPIICYRYGYEEAKKIANVKRRFRNIDDSCAIHHRVGNEITDASLGEFSCLHRQAYPNSYFDKPNAQEFYKHLIADEDFSGHVCLTTIEHKGQIIAGHFGFQGKDVFYYYVPAYDERFGAYGPGQFLLWNLITIARAQNMQEFDLLRGSEAYKFNWTNKINANYTVFGISPNDSLFKMLVVNLWLLTKNIPFFNQRMGE